MQIALDVPIAWEYARVQSRRGFVKHLTLLPSGVCCFCNSYLPNSHSFNGEAVLSASGGLDLVLVPRLLEVLKVSLLHPVLFELLAPAHLNRDHISLIPDSNPRERIGAMMQERLDAAGDSEPLRN